MIKTIVCLLLLWTGSPPGQAQTEIERLLTHPEFQPILTKHLKEVNLVSKSGIPNVSILLFKPNVDSLTVYLTAISYMSEAKENLPTSFTTVEGQPFLIYDGSENLIMDQQQWLERVRKFVGKHLCDNLEYLELLKQPGPKSLTIPCASIYDATIDEIVFKAGKLVRQKQVVRVPYYLNNRSTK